MKRLTRTVRIVDGKRVLLNPHEATMFSDAMKLVKSGTLVRETVETITDTDAAMDIARAAYFAMLDDIVSHANEDFTESLAGKTQSAKADALDMHMRHLWCETFGMYTESRNPITGAMTRQAFRLTRDKCELTEDQLRKYAQWVHDMIDEYHRNAFGYGLPERGRV
jgi:hypothetical protein